MSLTENLLLEFGPDIKSLTIIPGSGGVFDVQVNDKLIFSSFRDGGFPEFEDVKQFVKGELRER